MAECFDPYRLALAAGVMAQSGDMAGAEGLLNRALELAPEDVAVIFQLGGLAEAKKDYATAAARFEQCTVLAPDFADGWAHLGNMQAQLKQGAAAEKTILAGLAKCPGSPGLHLARARQLRDAGRSPEAITEFEASIRLRPNEPDAYVELGNLYLQLGNEAAAMRQMRAAYEADPGDPLALSVLAYGAISAHDEAAARQWLARIAQQPRVEARYRAQVLDLYRQTFGHEWRP
jgi:tetratricopeptide (TPR) repeat protein